MITSQVLYVRVIDYDYLKKNDRLGNKFSTFFLFSFSFFLFPFFLFSFFSFFSFPLSGQFRTLFPTKLNEVFLFPFLSFLSFYDCYLFPHIIIIIIIIGNYFY